ITRQTVALVENANLTRGLEARVAARTAELAKSESAARSLLTRYELAEDAGQVGSFEWEIAPDHVEWSDGLYRIMRLSRDECEGTSAGFLKLVHPDDYDGVVAHIGESIERGGTISYELRVIRSDGTEAWISVKGRVISEGGNAARVAGVLA